MLGIFCWRQKRGLFWSVFAFLKEHSGYYVTEKRGKMAKKEPFWAQQEKSPTCSNVQVALVKFQWLRKGQKRFLKQLGRMHFWSDSGEFRASLGQLVLKKLHRKVVTYSLCKKFVFQVNEGYFSPCPNFPTTFQYTLDQFLFCNRRTFCIKSYNTR